MKDLIKTRGVFLLEQYAKDGTLIKQVEIPNLVTYEGRDHMLDATFRSASQNANWYIGFIDNSGFSAVALTDTHDSHPGWTEVSPYSEATRVAWGPDAASNGVITNTTSADFNINATAAIKGIFISNISTKGSVASGVLFNATTVTTEVNVVSSNLIKVTYQLTLS